MGQEQQQFRQQHQLHIPKRGKQVKGALSHMSRGGRVEDNFASFTDTIKVEKYTMQVPRVIFCVAICNKCRGAHTLHPQVAPQQVHEKRGSTAEGVNDSTCSYGRCRFATQVFVYTYLSHKSNLNYLQSSLSCDDNKSACRACAEH